MDDFPHSLEKKSRVKLARTRQRRNIKVKQVQQNSIQNANLKVSPILLEIVANVLSSLACINNYSESNK